MIDYYCTKNCDSFPKNINIDLFVAFCMFDEWCYQNGHQEHLQSLSKSLIPADLQRIVLLEYLKTIPKKVKIGALDRLRLSQNLPLVKDIILDFLNEPNGRPESAAEIIVFLECQDMFSFVSMICSYHLWNKVLFMKLLFYKDHIDKEAKHIIVVKIQSRMVDQSFFFRHHVI